MRSVTKTRPEVLSASVPSKAPRAWIWLSPIAGSTSITSPLNTLPGSARNINSAANPGCRRCREFWRKAAV
ncbi:Uncharacterised protein [Vibrio cholerae]|nr:Uncharacterised protein [Vibrio cholerae]CSC62092.1 Uncharacterised protein [Vibrio cholerae]